MKRSAYLLFFLISSVLADAVEDPGLISTEFRVFPVQSFDDQGIFYKPSPEEVMQEIRFRPRSRSLDSYEYQGSQPLTFYREDGLDPDGIMQYRPVGKVDVVGRELLVFFSPKRNVENDSAEFALLGIDDGPNALPADHVTFLNFTSIPFVGRFIDDDIVLNPGLNPSISVQEHLEEDVFIGLAIRNKESHRVVLKSNWQFHPNNRHYILLLPPQREGSFRIRAFQISEYVGSDGRFVGQ